MAVAAFLDAERRSRPGSSAAGELEALSSDLASLELGGYQLAIDEVEVGGIPALSFKVVIDSEPVHDPDWTAIRGMLEAAGGRGLDDAVVERALGIFSRLAEAEAKLTDLRVEASLAGVPREWQGDQSPSSHDRLEGRKKKAGSANSAVDAK